MKVKLGDIFEISSGGTPSKSCPEYYGGDVPWVKTGDLKSEYIYGVADFITEDGLRNSSAKMYEEDTVLMAMYGATIGATSILKISACTNQACAAFRRNDKVIPEYLYYFLKSQKEKFVKDGVGGAQPNISAGYLKKVEMELLLIKEQRIVVDILDKITNIINRRNQELIALDELIKARFVEMFGDPKINEKRWNSGIISDYYEVKGGKRIPKGMGYSGEVTTHPYLRATDMKNETILDDDIHYIDDEVYEHIKKYIVKGGDIYLTNVGVNLGMAGVIPDKYDGANLTENAVKLVPKTEKIIDGRFLAHYINSPGIQEYINERKMSVGVPKLAIFRIETMPLLLPPIDIQIQFVKLCNQVDKSKVAVQKALDETQLLFDSLMQQYFG